MSGHAIKENANFLINRLQHLYTVKDKPNEMPWRLSTKPFLLEKSHYDQILALGSHLAAFYKAINKLYFLSIHEQMPAFVARYLEQGKPEYIIKMMRQNRFKNALPNVIRPDLLLTESGLVASELDSVPGGMGFVSELALAYSQLGYPVIGHSDGILRGFSKIFTVLTNQKDPNVAIIVSDESIDYLAEMNSLAHLLREQKLLNCYVCRPQHISYQHDGLYLNRPESQENIRIDAVYRFFELFDLLNVPKHELILYAARHKQVAITPPPKAQLEEKMLFAFLWHPALKNYWLKELGDSVLSNLQKCIPQTWIIDPAPMPAQACINGLCINNEPIFNWNDLVNFKRKERDFVIKPSGFSELAWGSHGVIIGNTLCEQKWSEAMDNALASYEKIPYILQKFSKTKAVKIDYYNINKQDSEEMVGRVRLCPFYFNCGEQTELGGILATVSPISTDIIHGTSNSIMTVCMVDDSK